MKSYKTNKGSFKEAIGGVTIPGLNVPKKKNEIEYRNKSQKNEELQEIKKARLPHLTPNRCKS